MGRFIEGTERSQSTLFPESLEDWIDEDNPVRVVDVFVEELDLLDLGFERVEPASTVRPGYHPTCLLKLYIYGYLNQVQSSRRLEREAGRNVELMWLTGRLVPDHKTIADFRKDNGPAIKKVCATFIALCHGLGMFAEASVAIDGSKFKAVNRQDKNFTAAKLKRRLEHYERSAAQYLGQLDSADRQEPSLGRERNKARLHERLETMKREMARLEAIEEQRLEAPDKQISLTDPDCRSMTTAAWGKGIVGYNLQAAVDTTHHLIVCHEVTNQGTDHAQLSSIGKMTKAALGVDKLEAVADRGYFSGKEILACKQAGIAVTLPKPSTSNSRSKGRFTKHDFRYVPDRDVYVCPAGEDLKYRYQTEERGLILRRYWTGVCEACVIRDKCTTGKQRRVTRWEHEDVLEDVQRRLDEHPEKMRLRRETAEHPFGTIKAWMGATHFQMKTLPKVGTEMALHVLAYNMKRMMNIFGIGPLMAAIRA